MLPSRPVQRPLGKLIFLHGASSSGKSTIARALQERLAEPFWHISIDHLRDSGVLPIERIRRGDFEWPKLRGAFFDGFHASLGAYLASGNNLIVEHIIEEPAWRSALMELFAPYDLFFVAVHCPLPELNRREASRRDRRAGSAAADFDHIHKGLSYDLEVDGQQEAASNAAIIIAAWERRQSLSAFFAARPAL
ncbi:MAG: AAA family ATPase [Devosia sp.]